MRRLFEKYYKVKCISNYMSQEQVISRDYIIGYIDILGFKNYIKKCFDNDVKVSSIQFEEKRVNYINAMNNSREFGINLYLNLLRDNDYHSFANQINLRQISDSFIISIPIDLNNKLDLFGKIIAISAIIINYQQILLLSNFLTRGAVSLGLHYEDKENLFSHALIKAVEMEKEVADVPRIIIEKEIITLLKSLIKEESIKSELTDSDESKLCESILHDMYLKDWDDQFFLNFLLNKNTKEIIDKTKNYYKQEQRDQLNNINVDTEIKDSLEKLKANNNTEISNEKDASIIKKRLWLREYINWRIDDETEKSNIRFKSAL